MKYLGRIGKMAQKERVNPHIQQDGIIGWHWPQGGGGTLIFSYIPRLGSFLWVQNFEFQ